MVNKRTDTSHPNPYSTDIVIGVSVMSNHGSHKEIIHLIFLSCFLNFRGYQVKDALKMKNVQKMLKIGFHLDSGLEKPHPLS